MIDSDPQRNKHETSLRWRFDVNTFRLLGRELITDRITAIFELVKNAYDANSTQVIVDFFNITLETTDKSITISDNGMGMSLDDIKNKWMVVGTNSKRTSVFSPAPFSRKYLGEKGIGRFAVDKLGANLLIRTKQLGAPRWLNVEIRWSDYEKKSGGSAINEPPNLFTDIDNYYFFEDGNPNEQGTQLIITDISDHWTATDIERTYKELSRLVNPFNPLVPPFDIILRSNELQEYFEKNVKAEPLRFYSHQGEISYDLQTITQEVLKFDRNSGKIYKGVTDIKSFGPIKLRIYYFNQSAKIRYNSFYKNDETYIDGIKIYRDGVITTPFAEFEGDTSKRRDILGIDKRRWRATFDRIGTREIIGILEITKENNPKIIDATNRQDFIDNQEYRDLKEFIIQQVEIFGEIKEFERDKKRSFVERELHQAGREIKTFEQAIAQIEKEIDIDKPQIRRYLEPLRLQAGHLSSVISQSINEQKKFQKDVERKENIYLSLMSLQDYAANISHAVRTSLGKIKRMAEFFKINFPNPKYDGLFEQYACLIYDEMETLLKVTDFMLSYAGAEIDVEEFSVKDLLEDLLLNVYSQTFADENIQSIVEITDDFFINTNKKFFQDIFQNLVSNSVKALRHTTKKVVRCLGFLDSDGFTIYFSDNGTGIKKGDEKWIFEIYNTRTADQGGAGIGLYIVEKRIEALKGTIEVVESEFAPFGATFKIQLPLNEA